MLESPQIANRDSNNGNQVRGRPFAPHVRFPQSDVAAEKSAFEEAFIMDGDDGVKRSLRNRFCQSEIVGLVWADQFQASALEALKHSQYKLLCEFHRSSLG